MEATRAALLRDMIQRGFGHIGPSGLGKDWRLPEAIHSADPSLKDCLAAIGCYNNFDPFRVYLQLSRLKCEVEIGREGSPVLYIRPLDDEAKKWLVTAMEAVRGDEIDWRPDVVRGQVLRVWWD